MFEDVQIYFDGELEDGIKITIEVRESPVLNEVVFKGNKKLKDKKLLEELDFQKGMRIKPNLISNSIRTLKKLYLDDGYYLADIKASLNSKSNESTDIVFTIKENKKVKIKEINIIGNKNNFGWLATRPWLPIPQNLKNRLSLIKLKSQLKETKIRTWWRFWASGFDDNKFEEDLDLLSTFYQDAGYKDVSIISDTAFYSRKKMDWLFKFNFLKGQNIDLETSHGMVMSSMKTNF